MRSAIALAAVLLAACGPAGEPEPGPPAEGATDTFAATPPGTVDTTGVGVEPPTAGGQVLDTAAIPGPVDTVQGTPSAP